ncbi:MAG: dehydrogenase, FAD-containing subunit [Thermoleophilia bacterium]|nr:dehydrogenase, FAD-containing subunit [Thermoleophilia bacterium]
MQEVVVIGGGFAGLRVVRGLAKSPVRVTLIDRANHHCFQPLLYQVATGSLSPGEISAPLRWALRKQPNAQVVLGEVEDFDVDKRYVYGTAVDGSPLKVPYDHLVVAAGARHSYFGNDQWEAHAPGLKTAADALELRHRIFNAFELANLAKDADERRRLLTFVVIGAGPTGVELAGQIVEIARRTLRREYRRFDPADTRTVLLDAAPIVIPGFDPKLSGRALRQLEDMGVEVRLGELVTDVDERGVTAGEHRYDAGTIVWAAGVQGSPLGATLAQAVGVAAERGGRIPVEDDFSLAGHPEIRIIGDLAATGLPGVAPVAMQQGVWTAKSIDAFERRTGAPRAFRYRNRGSMATIGRRRAVAHIGKLKLSGTIAWLAWLFVHLMYIIGFANRVLVVVRWSSAFIAGGRGERIITDTKPANVEADRAAS